MQEEEKPILTLGNIGHSPPDLPAFLYRGHTRSSTQHKGFESEKVRKKGLLKVLKKVVGKKKDF